ncbi:MAG: flagellar filament capping protein FliD [Gemmatimonadetes bacterium]|nr:flagellar filament capping protein FliD [Gemmatimonadota bacterium]
MTSASGSSGFATNAQPTATVNGVVSGIQWQTMVDQIIAIDQNNELTPVTNRQSTAQSEAAAWNQMKQVVSQVYVAAAAMKDSSSFDLFSTTVGNSASTGHMLLSATASTGASPGKFSAEVLQLARSEKLGGNVVTSASTSLNLSGQFSLNGVLITVVAADSLASIREKINTSNTGTTPSGVTATIIGAGAGSQLVLTSDLTGAAGIQATDTTDGVLQSLGFSDGTTVANVSASGATQTNRVWSTTTAIAAALGVPLPAPSTIRVGGQSITVDLSVDSLTTIAAKINAALPSSSATVVSETVGSRTAYRLQTDATVEVDSGAAVPADSAKTLLALGFTNAGRGGLTGAIGSANVFSNGVGGAAAGATLLSNVQIGTQALALATNDVFTISGTRGDGTSVSTTFKITNAATATVSDLLAAINDATSGFGSGTRTATASIGNDGRIVLTDSTTGASQLGLSLTVARASGGTISLGSFSTATGGTLGRSRELVAGTDAQMRIDGQTVARATNTISDAVAGVTFNLLSAEVGSTVTVDVSHNVSALTSALNTFVSAYNSAKSWVKQATAAGGALAHNYTAKAMVQSMTDTLLTPIIGASGSLTSAAMVGLHHDKTGVLSLDTAVFQKMAASNFSDLQRLFTVTGTTSHSQLSFIAAGSAAKPSNTPYAVAITQAATLASASSSVWAGGLYVNSGTADTMVVTDGASGKTGTISLAGGDTLDAVVSRLNTAFADNGIRLVASNSGGKFAVDALDHGTPGAFTVAYTPGSVGDGIASLITAGSYTGLDVAGTINGEAATGRGQLLTGAKGNANTDSILLLFAGTTTPVNGDAGTLSFSLGLAGTLARISDGISANFGGTATGLSFAATTRASNLDSRIAAIQGRLDARRKQLTAQFTAMEAAMSKSNSLGSYLTSQMNALQAQSK